MRGNIQEQNMDDLFQSLMDYVLLRKFNIDREKSIYLLELEIKKLLEEGKNIKK